MWTGKLQLALIGTVIVATAIGVGWEHRSMAEQEREAQNQEAAALTAIVHKSEQTRQAIGRMASDFNAVSNWVDGFGGLRFSERLTNDDLAPILIRTDGRPLLVIGSLVEVLTEGSGCTLVVDAKANLLSNIRFWLACTPAQANEALAPLPNAQSDAVEQIREEEGEGIEQTPQEEQEDEREARIRARRGYVLIARVNRVRSEDAETLDDPAVTTNFVFAEGRCLKLLYVGNVYPHLDSQAYLLLDISEVERRARQQWRFEHGKLSRLDRTRREERQ